MFEDEYNVVCVYNMVCMDVVGFEDYVRLVKCMFDDDVLLCDLMEGLFYIVMVDGIYYLGEDVYLCCVLEIFGFDECWFCGFKVWFVFDMEMDVYDILGVMFDILMDEVCKVW